MSHSDPSSAPCSPRTTRAARSRSDEETVTALGSGLLR